MLKSPMNHPSVVTTHWRSLVRRLHSFLVITGPRKRHERRNENKGLACKLQYHLQERVVLQRSTDRSCCECTHSHIPRNADGRVTCACSKCTRALCCHVGCT